MIRKYSIIFFIASLLFSINIEAQLNINSAVVTIENGAVVAAHGSVFAEADILGTGKLIINGNEIQKVDMNGFSVPNLEINNPSNAILSGNIKIGSSLLFTDGKIFADSFNISLSDVTIVSGMGPSKFIETNGAGQALKELTADITSNEIPLGAGTVYRPVFITTTGAYNNGKVGVKLLDTIAYNKPPMISDYISAHWPITQSGITGTVSIAGQYLPSDVTGDEDNLRGYYFNGTDWSSEGETHIPQRVSAIITAAEGNLYAMDKFALLKAKVFLQGAYNSSTGKMDDKLRTPVNLIPFSDPYRAVPYNTIFTHVDNQITEIANASVFNDQASPDDNIVDWVFLELRDTILPGNTVLQTRSALLQKDGDIVDIDGLSPVTFNNISTSSENYTIVVKHRNHLGLSTDPSSYSPVLNERKSTAALVDFTSEADANLYGNSSAFTVINGKNLLWGGNIDMNNIVKFNGPNNDKDYLLSTVLAGDATSILNGYNAADISMDKIVKYAGPNNDKDFLLATILNGIHPKIITKSLPQ